MLGMDAWQLPGDYHSSGATDCLKGITPEDYSELQQHLLDCEVHSALLSRLPGQTMSPEAVKPVKQAQEHLVACEPKWPALMGSNTLRDLLMKARFTLSASHRV